MFYRVQLTVRRLFFVSRFEAICWSLSEDWVTATGLHLDERGELRSSGTFGIHSTQHTTEAALISTSKTKKNIPPYTAHLLT